MATVREDTAGKIRDMPIDQRLKTLLSESADQTGIDLVRVTSGGQPGSHGQRTGSHRHDHGMAADLEIWIGNRPLDFTKDTDRPLVATFVEACARNGATGIGAGIDYMGPITLHVGFGTTAVWGAGGRSVNAPAWLVQAVNRGWSNSISPMFGEHVVAARNGLRLRGGPGPDFGVITTIAQGTKVSVVNFDGANREWARVDLQGDGSLDGHLHAAFLSPSILETDEGEDEPRGHDDLEMVAAAKPAKRSTKKAKQKAAKPRTRRAAG